MVDFKALKARSQNIAANIEGYKKLNEKKEFEDNDSTFWSPSRGKDGNGFALIRFLGAPQVDGDDAVPYVKYFRHAFQGPTSGEWYIENCLTTLNRKDPVNDLTRILYKSGTEFDKSLAMKYKRKATYVTNILVIKDEQNPANNGQLKKFRFGVKIWEKIEAAMAPKFGDAIDPFDMWEHGANFGLVTKTVGDFANYDDSKFDRPGILGPDDMIKDLWERSYSLKAFLDESKFKPYEELKEKLDSILTFSYADRGSAASAAELMATQVPLAAASTLMRNVNTPAQQVKAAPVDETPPWEPSPAKATVGTVSSDDDDEELAALKEMANR